MTKLQKQKSKNKRNNNSIESTVESYSVEQYKAYIINLVQSNFYAYCVFMDSKFFTEKKWHLRIFANTLQKVADGFIKKLIISVPPRAGKSYTLSLFCSWLIGRGKNNPDTSIMRNSYGASLAEKFSKDVRSLILSNKFKSIFGEISLKEDQASVEDWAIEQASQSTYFCSGVGGAITGKGCKTVGIADDLIKNLEDALSETIIEKTWGWYTSTHKSRFESGCAEIICATRWSINDPTGKVLDLESDWTVVSIPALDENDKSFCEEVKTTEEYLALRRITDSFVWEAEYQQNPVQAKGLLFPINELNRFNESDLIAYTKGKSEKEIKYMFDAIVGYTDIADEGSDFLCSVVGKLIGYKVYITDVIYTQDPVEVTIPLVTQQIIKTETEYHKLESNAGGKLFGMKVREQASDEASCQIKWEQTTKNKETRILMGSGLIKTYFYFRDDYSPESDYAKFMKALTSYIRLGKNKHDDAPDAVTGLLETLNKRFIKFP